MAACHSRRLFTNFIRTKNWDVRLFKWTILESVSSLYLYRPLTTSCLYLKSHISRRGDFLTPERAREFVYGLDVMQRDLLMNELTKFEQERQDNGSSEVEPLTGEQFRYVMLYSGIPFIGFGFLDNLIMIVAGEYIDVTLGAVLGITTMAAAALGNLVSDVIGVGCAGYVEMIGSKLGMHAPDITPRQVDLKETRYAAGVGRSIGIIIGCLLGMVPLLFYKGRPTECDTSEDENH